MTEPQTFEDAVAQFKEFFAPHVLGHFAVAENRAFNWRERLPFIRTDMPHRSSFLGSFEIVFKSLYPSG
jgi:hypothetical protein